MTFNNCNKARGLEKFTSGSNESFGQERFLNNKKFSYNAGLFEAIGMEKSSVQKTSSCSISNMSEKNPNLYQYEIVNGSSRSTDSRTGLIFSFWTESKKFDWNFDEKYRRTICQDKRNVCFKKNSQI